MACGCSLRCNRWLRRERLRTLVHSRGDVPVMTTATRNAPRRTARQASHHVNPIVTNDATVAQVPGLIRSDTQSTSLELSRLCLRPDSHPKKVQLVHRRCAKGDGSMSITRQRVCDGSDGRTGVTPHIVGSDTAVFLGQSQCPPRRRSRSPTLYGGHRARFEAIGGLVNRTIQIVRESDLPLQTERAIVIAIASGISL